MGDPVVCLKDLQFFISLCTSSHPYAVA
jgi:hypothetical protein